MMEPGAGLVEQGIAMHIALRRGQVDELPASPGERLKAVLDGAHSRLRSIRSHLSARKPNPG